MGTPAVGYIGLSNEDNTNVTVESIKITGTDFKLTKNGCPKVLPPFYGCADVQITFTPTALGVRTGTATVTVSDLSTPLIATLEGVGVSAGIGALSTNSLSFPEQAIGTTSAAQTIALTNTGTGVLTLGAITASSQFLAANNCGTTLGAGASCNVSVSFAPTLVGILDGTLTVQDDGTGSPHSVALGGIGQ